MFCNTPIADPPPTADLLDAFVRAGEPPATVAPIEIVTTSATPFVTMRHFI